MTDRNSRAVGPDEASLAFYRRVLKHLRDQGVEHLVGGAYAFRHYTGIDRCTRDFDVFLAPEHVESTIEGLKRAGFDAETVFPHWLAKVRQGDDYVDLIWSSGNGIARVDRAWFEHATTGEALGVPVRFCAIEEMIWSKGYIMERERFDGADVLHLIRSAERIDWERLRARFGNHRRVLLAHLLLFAFVYPAERHRVPETLLHELFAAAMLERTRNGRVCLGTLLSRSQYLPDLERGDRDGRLAPHGVMSPDEIAIWTEAAEVPAPKG